MLAGKFVNEVVRSPIDSAAAGVWGHSPRIFLTFTHSKTLFDNRIDIIGQIYKYL